MPEWDLSKESMTTPKPIFEQFDGGALKHAEGKARVDLITKHMIFELARGLEAGIKKGYPANNWRKGIPLTISAASALRHLLKWMDGEDIDPETGVNHMSLAMLNAGMAADAIARGRTDLDDRYRGK